MFGPGRTLLWLGLLALVSLVRAPPALEAESRTTAQPRLVVFEAFLNPG